MLIKRHIIIISKQCLNTNQTSRPGQENEGELRLWVLPKWVTGVESLQTGVMIAYWLEAGKELVPPDWVGKKSNPDLT